MVVACKLPFPDAMQMKLVTATVETALGTFARVESSDTWEILLDFEANDAFVSRAGVCAT